jgi:hypothetical protein
VTVRERESEREVRERERLERRVGWREITHTHATHTYTHTHIHTYTHTHIHTHTHSQTMTHKHKHKHKHIHTHNNTYMNETSKDCNLSKRGVYICDCACRCLLYSEIPTDDLTRRNLIQLCLCCDCCPVTRTPRTCPINTYTHTHQHNTYGYTHTCIRAEMHVVFFGGGGERDILCKEEKCFEANTFTRGKNWSLYSSLAVYICGRHS